MPRDNRQGIQEAIVDAAERLLDRYGYSKMTMMDLAHEAGIGVGTTYLYFPGKADVVLAVLERLHISVEQRLQEIAASHAAPADRLRGMLAIRLHLLYASARSHRHQMDDLRQAVQTAVVERRAAWIEAETSLLVSVLEEGRRAGAFDLDDTRTTAEVLMLATSGLAPRNLSRGDLEQPDVFSDKVGRLVTLLLHGLVTRHRVSGGDTQGTVCEV